MEALGSKDKQLAQLVDASNAVFATFAQGGSEPAEHAAPAAGRAEQDGHRARQAGDRLGKVGPTLRELDPFAKALGAGATKRRKRLALKTTPVIKNEIRPFAREILPIVNELAPATKQLGEAFPKLSTSFSVLNEFFNELAYNPGPSKAGFLFFLAWGNHNLNSVVSTADAHGPLGRSLVYFNCEILPILNGVAEVNPTVNLLVGLLKPPTKQECISQGLLNADRRADHRQRAHGHSQGSARQRPVRGPRPARRCGAREPPTTPAKGGKG